MKGRTIAEHLAEHPIGCEEDREFSFPNENIMEVVEDQWKLYFDGATNMKGYGVGIVLVSPNGDHTPLAVKFNFNSTNNTAEYETCILGMEVAIELKI